MGMEDTSCSVSDLECQEELHTLKASIMKAHTYSQGQSPSLGGASLWCPPHREQREKVLPETGKEEEVCLLHSCQGRQN